MIKEYQNNLLQNFKIGNRNNFTFTRKIIKFYNFIVKVFQFDFIYKIINFFTNFLYENISIQFY